MPTFTRSASSPISNPLPGSPGSATIGLSREASNSSTSQYSAPGSLASPAHNRSASAWDSPRYAIRYSTVFSSGATYPVNPPTSAVMFVMVARSSTDSVSTASPQYSTSLPIAWPLLI